MMRTMTPIFSIIVALVVFMFFTKPMFAEVKAIQVEVRKFEDAAEKAEERNTELARKIEQRNAYSASLRDKLDTMVPSDIDEVYAFATLDKMAAKYQLLLGDIGISSDAERIIPVFNSAGMIDMRYEDLNFSDLDFTVVGTYDQFKLFLADLERSLSFFEVTKLGFSGTEGELEKYDLSVRLFSLPNVVPDAGGGAPTP